MKDGGRGSVVSARPSRARTWAASQREHVCERITQLVLHNKSGFSAVPATLVVDATGDADVAVLSGCETVIGRKQHRLMTPVTLQVHMDGIDQEALAGYINRNDSPRFLTEIEKLRGKGEWPFIYERFITVQMQTS